MLIRPDGLPDRARPAREARVRVPGAGGKEGLLLPERCASGLESKIKQKRFLGNEQITGEVPAASTGLINAHFGSLKKMMVGKGGRENI